MIIIIIMIIIITIISIIHNIIINHHKHHHHHHHVQSLIGDILDHPDLLWTDDIWDEKKEMIAKNRLLQQDNKGYKISNYWKNNYISKAHIYWHQFYQRNHNNFYKDRHYLHIVFPELLYGGISSNNDNNDNHNDNDGVDVNVDDSIVYNDDESLANNGNNNNDINNDVIHDDHRDHSNNNNHNNNNHHHHHTHHNHNHHHHHHNRINLLEVGCGVGNAVIPLININPYIHIIAIDFAKSAIDILNQHSYVYGTIVGDNHEILPLDNNHNDDKDDDKDDSNYDDDDNDREDDNDRDDSNNDDNKDDVDDDDNDNNDVSKHHCNNNNNNNISYSNNDNNNRRIITAVCNIINDKIPVTLNSMDISLCMFVLSAISPSDQQIGDVI